MLPIGATRNSYSEDVFSTLIYMFRGLCARVRPLGFNIFVGVQEGVFTLSFDTREDSL